MVERKYFKEKISGGAFQYHPLDGAGNINGLIFLP